MSIVFVIIFIILLISLMHHHLFNERYNCNGENSTKKYGDYVRSAHSGLIRGVFIGLVLGAVPLEAAVKNAAIFGVINPLAMYLGY